MGQLGHDGLRGGRSAASSQRGGGATAGQLLTVEATPLNTTAELGAMALDSAQELAAYAAAAEALWSAPKA